MYGAIDQHSEDDRSSSLRVMGGERNHRPMPLPELEAASHLKPVHVVSSRPALVLLYFGGCVILNTSNTEY